MKYVLPLLFILLLAACGNGHDDYYLPSRGTWEGSVFSNEYLGLRFTLPDTWQASTEEQIAYLSGLTLGMLTTAGSEVSDEVWDAVQNAVIYDMLAQNALTGASAMIWFQQLPRDERHMTERDFLTDIAQIQQGMGIGYDNFYFPTETIRIGAVDWYAMHTEIRFIGGAFYQYYFVSIRDGFVRYIILAHSADGETLESMLALFTAL